MSIGGAVVWGGCMIDTICTGGGLVRVPNKSCGNHPIGQGSIKHVIGTRESRKEAVRKNR
jgi:hypothetical protein